MHLDAHPGVINRWLINEGVSWGIPPKDPKVMVSYWIGTHCSASGRHRPSVCWLLLQSRRIWKTRIPDARRCCQCHFGCTGKQGIAWWDNGFALSTLIHIGISIFLYYVYMHVLFDIDRYKYILYIYVYLCIPVSPTSKNILYDRKLETRVDSTIWNRNNYNIYIYSNPKQLIWFPEVAIFAIYRPWPHIHANPNKRVINVLPKRNRIQVFKQPIGRLVVSKNYVHWRLCQRIQFTTSSQLKRQQSCCNPHCSPSLAVKNLKDADIHRHSL